MNRQETEAVLGSLEVIKQQIDKEINKHSIGKQCDNPNILGFVDGLRIGKIYINEEIMKIHDKYEAWQIDNDE